MNKPILIKSEKLCKSFITGKTANNVLKNIDLEIYEGDFTVIMGSSGSGKSTLLYSLSSMDQPTSGSIEFAGAKITGKKEKEVAMFRRNMVSFIFQGINLLPDLTAFENIAYAGYEGHSKREVNEKTDVLLTQFGLYEDRHKYPGELSGGQQQRVAIARALIHKVPVIFGDEPTGALNKTAGEDVLNLLTGLHEKGQSIVMVTHDLKACARGNRILYLTDGRIDGELNLQKFRPEEKKQREETIYQFLSEHNW